MSEKLYTVRIAKATALIADTKTILAFWDLNLGVADNFERVRQMNLFGGASRARANDVLRVFKQRYFADPQIGQALAVLVQGNVPGQWLEPLFYYFSARNDATLYDLILEVVYKRQASGFSDVTVEHAMQQLRDWVAEGKTAGSWTDKTVRIVAQHALAALRDFGVLQGKMTKSITPLYLPVESFTFLAFEMWHRLGSGEKVLHSPDWNLFFLPTQGVERFFLEAHQARMLSYHAAGSVIRLEFEQKSLVEVAHALVERAR